MERNVTQEGFELQLSEFQMMEAMYGGDGELDCSDPVTLADMEDFVEGRSNIVPAGRLEYTIHIKTEQRKMALAVSLPLDYPVTKPQVSVRCDGCNREWHEKFQESLVSYIRELEEGTLCVGMIISWIQEKLNETSELDIETSPSAAEMTIPNHELEFSRYWIYSHHIYSSTKRKNILTWAQDYDITGFCLPGKPGIMCMEGSEGNCFDMWQKIRAMNWQKILIKHKETRMCTDLGRERRFQQFVEIAFAGGVERHMDMAAFREYLVVHESEYMFKTYFGMEYKAKK